MLDESSKVRFRELAPRLYATTRGIYRSPRHGFGLPRLARAAGLGPRLGRLVHHRPRSVRWPEPVAAPAHAPTISLVTPSFQHGAWIRETLRSALDQDYPALEYVVQDGGSTDGTAEILASQSSGLLAWESVPDGGQADAVNRGFAKTTGEVMAWLNSDDLLAPGSLARVARYFRDHADVDVVYGHRILIDARGLEVGRWLLPAHDERVLQWVDFVPQETLFWRRRAWEAVGGHLDETYRFAMDWDLLLRFQEAGQRIVRIPAFLGAFRVHESQKTQAISQVGAREMARLRTRSIGREPAPHEVHRAIRGYLLRHLWLDGRYRSWGSLE